MNERLREAIRLLCVLCVLPYVAAIFALTVSAKNCGHLCLEPLILLATSAAFAALLFIAALLLIRILRKREQPIQMVSAAMVSQAAFLFASILLLL